MVKALIPDNEIFRLQELYAYEILDTPEEEDFNEIVRLASDICKTPISTISLIDSTRQWLKAKIGLEGSSDPRDIAFCSHTILNGEIFIVEDATLDERFRDNPLVTGKPDIRFYAGVPLISPNGGRLGSLCVIDRVPRVLDGQHKDTLIILARQVVRLLELHKKNQELKQITREEKRQRKELEKASLMQKKMISILAHDIRSPLSSLKSLLQLMPDLKGGAEASGHYLEMAGNQLNSTLGLLDNIVEWGQLQLSGDPDPKECSLREIAQEVITDLEIPAGLKGLTLRNRVSPDICIRSDENRIRFILRNLVTNSIKFTKEGSITIDGALSQKTVLISVEDTGIGIPPAILEQLFQGGKKISRKGTRNEAGSGLGLTLVKEFAEKMNGRVTAESKVGKGSLIAISLPC